MTLPDGIATLRGTGRLLDKLVLLTGFTVPLTPPAELLRDSWDQAMVALRGDFQPCA